ncbi:MAG: glucose-1-phosphate adenylyltransferase [Gammaproteobacteria bacterium]|jgi:glucose-1-phosphate adenylyltransferase
MRDAAIPMLLSNQNSVLTVVLATGDGKPLMPLTQRRTVAAIPYAGAYRVIDFALSNCLYSGLRRVMVFSQFNALSLHNHIRDGWSLFNADLNEYVMPVTPPIENEMTTYSGYADALVKNAYLLERTSADHVIVVSGEQIYRMDYAAVLAFHLKHDSTVTVGTLDTACTNRAELSAVLKLRGHKVVGIEPFVADQDGDSSHGPMEVFVFKKAALMRLLEQARRPEVNGRAIIDLIKDHWLDSEKINAYRFGGADGRVTQDKYWRMLGSVDDYYDVNMDLLKYEPPLDIYQADWAIRTHQTQGPPARTVSGPSGTEGICVNSIIANGTVIAGGGVSRSILGNRVYIDDGATVEDSILSAGVQVGAGTQLRRCVIDRNVVIPANEEIGLDRKLDAQRFTVTPNGVVVIPSDATFN